MPGNETSGTCRADEKNKIFECASHARMLLLIPDIVYSSIHSYTTKVVYVIDFQVQCLVDANQRKPLKCQWYSRTVELSCVPLG